MARSVCRDEVILDIFKECQKRKAVEKTVEIRIYLGNCTYTTLIGYKKDFLNSLKEKGIIDNYKTETETREYPPETIEESFEDPWWLSPLAAPEDIENAPKKYMTMEGYSETDCFAVIKCNPQKVMQYFNDNFQRIGKKEKEVMKINEIKSIFKKERVLRCGELEFGLESGNVIYGKVTTNFMPGKKEYKLLKILMEHPNKRMPYDLICATIFDPRRWEGQKNETVKREIGFIMQNIKSKLKILGENRKNKNLFLSCNGYMIVCDSE